MITHLIVDGFEAVGAAPAGGTGCGDCMLQTKKTFNLLKQST